MLRSLKRGLPADKGTAPYLGTVKCCPYDARRRSANIFWFVTRGIVTAVGALLACHVGVLAAQSNAALAIARQNLVSDLPGSPQERISVDQLGNLYFVDRRAATLNVLNILTDRVATVFTAHGTLADFALDSSGRIWVAVLSNGSAEIFRLSPIAGPYILSTPAQALPISLDRPIIPVSLAVDSAGDLYVADAKQHSILRVHSDGSTTTLIPNLTNPGQMAVDGVGTVYVEDPDLGVILRYRQGEVRSFIPLDNMTDIAVDSADNLYLAGKAGVVQIGSDGKIHARFPLCPSGAYRVAISPDGRLFASGSAGVYELPTSNSPVYDFGETILTRSSVGELAVCNSRPSTTPSKVPITFSSSGTSSSEFSESNHLVGSSRTAKCSTEGLSSHATCILELRFTPTITGTRTAILSIRSGSGVWTIPLSGTGVL